MTLLWFDGFESQDVLTAYTQTGGLTVATFSDTRFAYGNCAAISAGSAERLIGRTITASSQVFVGAATKSGGIGNSPLFSFWGDSGVTRHITIRTNPTNHSIDIMRGVTAGTLLASSANNIWSDGTWFYVEASCTISDTVGAVEVRLNGSTTPVVTYSGDTKNAGTLTDIDAIAWGTTNATTDRIDDIYACNSLGSAPTNTFLGDVRSVISVPTGAGSSTGLTPSTGSNWQTVDEMPAVATDYSGSPTPGARDTYAMTDLLSSAASVLGVRLTYYMHKSDAGTGQMKPAMKIGSNVYYGTTRLMNSSMTGYDELFTVSPATSTAWTISEVNAMEIGAEVV